MALSKDAKFRMEHALTSKPAADETSAAIDASTVLSAANDTLSAANAILAAANAAKVLGSNFIIAGVLIATATDNTDAAT